MDYIGYIIVGLGVGTLGFFIGFYKSKSELSRLEERNENLQKQSEESQQREISLKKDLETELDQERIKLNSLSQENATLAANYSNLKQKLDDQKGELEEMQEHLRVQFENLANKILEEKTEKFTKQNKESLNLLLSPLGEKLEEFKNKVEEKYKDEVEARGSLKQELKQLLELNQKMSEDAKNLTKALKGDTKTQGNWGEVILERILEKSGLAKGREYDIQQSTTTEDGRRLQPDVVVNLPDNKFLIVDSKVSLTAYEKLSSSDDQAEADKALKQHVLSIRSHVKGLSEKNYQQLYGDRSPNFVLLFIPIESAFGIAIQNDPNLYYEAFERDIVIVSPSTLLATLATIASVWKQEYQSKNAMEIAKRGGALYDKFVGFVESMETIGQRIRQTQDSYDEAIGRLSTGSGNLVRQAEQLKKLGVKASKTLSENITDNTEEVE